MNTWNYIKDQHKQNLNFFLSLYVFSFLSILYLVTHQKGDLVLFFSDNRTDFLNTTFVILSIAGEGIHFGYLLIILSFIRIRFTILGLITFLGTGAIVQVLKRSFDMPRPSLWFENVEILNLLDGVRNAKYLSFPSGHTTSAFAMAMFFLILTKNKSLKLLISLIAILMGLSRVYLAQHFLEDILVGALLGTYGGLFFIALFESNEKIKNSNWYNFSVISIIGRKTTK